MCATPNRLETHWPSMRQRILQEWDRLSPEEVDQTDGEFDKLVHLIRIRYGGRADIIQEAAIRNVLTRILQQVEV